jgi:hypothetical protein
MKMKNKIIISRYCLICFLLLIFCNGCGQSSDIKPGTESFPEENPTNTPTAESTPTETPDPMLNMFVEHLLEGDFDKVSGLYVFDIDGDGDQDIIGAAMGDREIAWWRNNGGNPVSWVKQVIAENLVGAAYVHAEDVDGDLDGDVVAGAGSEIYWWRNEGGDPIVWTRITVAENLSESHAAVMAILMYWDLPRLRTSCFGWKTPPLLEMGRYGWSIVSAMIFFTFNRSLLQIWMLTAIWMCWQPR